MEQLDSELPAFNYFTSYAEQLHNALLTISPEMYEIAVNMIEDATHHNKQIFVCGNGGSAAIAEHMTCDHMKGVNNSTVLFPKLHSLSSNMSLITAIANDISYDDVFCKQLSFLGGKGDILVAISSSGKSPNIIKALRHAKAREIYTIALVGFDGGEAKDIADVTLHVQASNYGIVEDSHQAIMHTMAQTIRRKNLHPVVDMSKVIY